MGERATRIQELSDTYFQILQQLNSTSLPEWLQLDLTFQQMKVLYIIKQQGPLKMRELSERLGVTMPTITGIVNRLIDRKGGVALLSRVVSPEDRREVWAHLTEAGLEATEMLNRINSRLLESALAQLSEADLESMHSPQARLVEAVKEQIRAAKPAPAQPLPLEDTLISHSLVASVNVEADLEPKMEAVAPRASH